MISIMELVGLSFFILCAMLYARYYARRHSAKHVKLMSWVITADIVLVLYLSLGRHVLNTMMDKMTPLLALHIFLALACVAGYIYSAYVGIKLGKGQKEYRRKMIIADRIVLPTRIMVFITILVIKINASNHI